MAHHDSHGHALGHVVPIKVFSAVLGALLVLTVITVLAAGVDLGEWNIAGAMFIATIKASLVIWYFMHGAHENKILWTYIIIPFILLIIMIGGVFTDDPFRIKATPMTFGDAPVEEAAKPVMGHH